MVRQSSVSPFGRAAPTATARAFDRPPRSADPDRERNPALTPSVWSIVNRLPLPRLVLVLAIALVASACAGTTSSPALTDPTEIVTAALRSTEAAKSVHLDVKIDGTATIALAGLATGAETGTPVKLDGTTATVDVDFAAPAARVTFAAPSLLGLAGEIIAVNGKAYVKTTLTGPLYQESSAAAGPVDPGSAGSAVDNLGDLLTKEGVVLAKGADEPCGTEQCYAVTTRLTADQLGIGGAGSAAGLPIDLAGATADLKILVEQDAPNHLAGIDATLTMANGNVLTIQVAASKWDQPVTITAPPADQVKPAS
jgi:hypothetical protein